MDIDYSLDGSGFGTKFLLDTQDIGLNLTGQSIVVIMDYPGLSYGPLCWFQMDLFNKE